VTLIEFTCSKHRLYNGNLDDKMNKARKWYVEQVDFKGRSETEIREASSSHFKRNQFRFLSQCNTLTT